MSFYNNKKVLVTGGTGMIGRPLINMLLNKDAKVRIAALDKPVDLPQEFEFKYTDLRNYENCRKVCKGIDIVFNLIGVKGSPKTTVNYPASYFVPTLQFNTNMMEAARMEKVERYLYTSTIGIYASSLLFREDDVWKTMPSKNDWFTGWSKRMGELQAEAYKIEYGWDKISIVRPANVYGPHDYFDLNSAMVIPSLIRKIVDGNKKVNVWGDGTPVRDFIHARDVAEGMLLMCEKGINIPVNLGSGQGCTIKELVDIILNNCEHKPEIVYDLTGGVGDHTRVMDISRAKSFGFNPQISLKEGIKEVIQWYKENKNCLEDKYNIYNKVR